MVLFLFKAEKNDLGAIGETIAKDGGRLMQEALDKLVKDLGTQVILPAGDVFMFKGLSADSDHNVFTSIVYDTAT